MVAPNGARKLKADHPAIPITIAETVKTAQSCYKAGATGLHLHVRDSHGGHSLDASLYREAINELALVVPDMHIQITTEAVGIYTPAQQRQVVRDVKPTQVSISLAEMFSDGNNADALELYRWCKGESITVQHILYGPDDLTSLSRLLDEGHFSSTDLTLLFVLGRYATRQQSSPEDLTPFTVWLTDNNVHADWALCAFGTQETACLKHGFEAGGKIRVGFENSVWNADGSIATDNIERVSELKAILGNSKSSD